MNIAIPTPGNFNFKRTLLSHGWCTLLPCEFDRENWTLKRVFEVDDNRAVSASIHSSGKTINVSIASRKLNKRSLYKIERDVRHMFRLDDDMSDFYRVMSLEPSFAWIEKAGAGRMLRSPTVYEDLVKTICTTNCSWSLTVKMVAGLTNNLGFQTDQGHRAFPSPQAMADAPASFYRDEMRAGYRAPYFKELAERVASGTLEVESWLTSDLSTDELKREMKSVKGVGDYAAENLLKLVGRNDVLALDSWLRSQYAATHNKGRPCSDKKIERHYRRFTKWRGLALWCDMTREWIDEEGKAAK